MSADQIDLDAIAARAREAFDDMTFNRYLYQRPRAVLHTDVPALVAEVRRLRKVVESLEGFPFTEQRRWTDR